MSAYEAEDRRSGLDTFAGLMSATAIFLGLLGATNLNLSISGTHLEMRPIRIGVADTFPFDLALVPGHVAL